MLDFIAKISRRLHINNFLYIFFKKIAFVKKYKELNNLNVNVYLNSIYPDIKSSCLNTNTMNVNFSYDLSIIVPVYNVEQYLNECIESLLSQKTQYSFKIILINDGSTDNSPKILDSYSNNKNILIINQENKGLSGARNTRLKYIDSEYIMFVDSDDKIEDNCIELLLSQAKRYNSDITGCGYKLFNERSVLLTCESIDSPNNNNLNGFAWSKVYKSSIFKNFKFPEKYWFEDTFITWLLVTKLNNISSVHDSLYLYRRNKKSITFTSKGNPKILDTLYITKSTLEDIRNYFGNVQEHDLLLFLNQIILNFRRISTLNNKKINYAVFLETVNIFNEYFNTFIIKSDDIYIRNLFEALKTNNYKQYCLVCYFK